MKETSPLTAFSLGIVIVVLGSLLPKNENYNIIVIILGIIILLISIVMFFKRKKN